MHSLHYSAGCGMHDRAMASVYHLMSSFLWSGATGAAALGADGGGGLGAGSAALVNRADCLRSLSAKASIIYSSDRQASPWSMDNAIMFLSEILWQAQVEAPAFRWLGRSSQGGTA